MFRPAVFAALAAVAAVGAGAAHAEPPTHVVGYVYVNDNTSPVNTVAGYERLSDGTLTPIPGSPFTVGGSGTGHADASQGSLQLSQDNHFLLAVDAGSNQISVARIQHDGTLTPANGSPFSSNGAQPVSIAVSHDRVFVANAGAANTNYTGFKLDGNGNLRPLPGSTYPLPSNSQPGDIFFNNDGHKLVGTRVATSEIDSFTVSGDGQLTVAPGSPYSAQAFSPAQGWGQLGSEFSPNHPDELFVSDAHTAAGSPAPGLVSSFSVDPSGALTPVGAPVPNDGKASCWVEITHDGRYMFVVNTASATISSYAIGDHGALTFLQSTGPGQIGAGAEDARLSPDGKTLWVVESGTDAVTGFTVDGGTLTPLTAANGPTGATPSGIVVTNP